MAGMYFKGFIFANSGDLCSCLNTYTFINLWGILFNLHNDNTARVGWDIISPYILITDISQK